MITGAYEGSTPAVSIGLPVFNGQRTIEAVIKSILAQSFSDFELIVSDNCSTDGTEAICRAYAEQDVRIRYVRQVENVGPAENFKSVLSLARGRYYMWAASDDVRSLDFLMENVLFLDANPDYVASTCPNCFEGQEEDPSLAVEFSIVGDLASRCSGFLRHSWQSHGIFYSVMRTNVIRQCDVLGKTFIAVDWAIDFFLVSRGSIHRTRNGLAIFGRSGISNSSDARRAFRTEPVEMVLPLYRFSRYALGVMRPLTISEWLPVFGALVSLNFKASFDQTHAALYQFYCRHFKPTKGSGK